MSTIDPATAPVEVPAQIAPPAGIPIPRGPIRRVAAIGIGLGLVGALLSAGVALFTNALVQALYNLSETPVLSAFIVAVPALALGLNILLLFYGIRLATAGLPVGGAMRVTAELAKFRRVCGPLLVLQLLIVVLGQTEGLPLSLPFTALGTLCAAGCCYALLDSRRVAWDIALAQGAVFTPEHGIGFQVLTPAPSHQVAPPPAGAAPAPVLPRGEAPLPAIPAAAVPWARSSADDGSAYADWERVLYGLVLLIVILNLFDLPPFVRHAADYGNTKFWLTAWSEAAGLYTRRGPNFSVLGYGPATVRGSVTPADRWVRFFSLATGAVSGAVTFVWIIWGVVCVAVGPRARKAVLRLAYATILLALLGGGLRLYAYESAVGRYYGSGAPTFNSFGGYVQEWSGGRAGPFSSGRPHEELAFDARLDLFRQTTTDMALPILLLFVLTREPVKALFVRRPRRSR